MIQESDSNQPSDLIQELCARFRDQWNTDDTPPDLSVFVDDAPSSRRDICFRSLLTIDIAERQRRQLDVEMKQYSAKFPAHTKIIEDVLGGSDDELTMTSDILSPADSATRSLSEVDVLPESVAEQIPDQIGRYVVQRQLGSGGYGVVYLARDTVLERDVAIKVLRSNRADTPADVENFLEEAQTVAALDHPGIVPIYDFPQLDHQHFVVSKYIDGETLAQRQARSPLSISETVRLIARLAETLSFVHRRQIIHRDVKPGNILLSSDGECFLTDFGLALRDVNFGLEPGQMGTVYYMSPEQARGEAHLVDASSDLFSLGVVLYELLTGFRPFTGDDWQAVMKLICSHDPVPLRQRVKEIPRELERICLKMLQKRSSDRYRNAAALLDDLKHLAATEPDLPDIAPDTVAVVPHPSESGTDLVSSTGIVPRGLRSFDREDAIFFRDLLPGPRDREGVPDSLRFWKNRIEASEVADRFRVGVLYGPSGSGKSSFVKAGLIPLLDNRIAVLFAESTGQETAESLLSRLRAFYPDLPHKLNLTQSFAWIRQRRGGRSKRRLLIVIDQFEQWLHTWDRSDDAEMVLAMRQCDGEYLQGLLLVRDDFWIPVSEFSEAVGVDLVPSRNLAMVDLFDRRHARRVLAEYGRAYRRLDGPEVPLSKSQNAFLNLAVEGLATGDKVIPVQLAAFSEIMKTRDWDARSLKELGGVEGVGVRFLHESFSSPRTPAANRIHENAAQAILHSLLPGPNSNIKGATKSRKQLQAVSGYSDRERMFDRVIQLLDTDLRLITPIQITDDTVSSEDSRCYQLTHDFLVPAVREWIHRRQNQTHSGRTLIRLAERAEVWRVRPISSNLPSWWEWVSFLVFTRRRQRTPEQQQMMDVCNRRHGIATSLSLLALCICVALAVIFINRNHAGMLVDQMKTARSHDLAPILDQLTDYQYWSIAPVKQLADNTPANESQGLRARLTLLRFAPDDADLRDEIREQMFDMSPEDFKLLRSEIRRCECWTSLSTQLWPVYDEAASEHEQFRTALLLSAGDIDQEAERWKDIGDATTQQLVNQVFEDPRSAATWYECLESVAEYLRPHLVNIITDRESQLARRRVALGLFTELFQDSPRKLMDGLLNTDPHQADVLLRNFEKHHDSVIELVKQAAFTFPDVGMDGEQQSRISTRQANAAALLMRFEDREELWQLFKNHPLPGTRSKLIEQSVVLEVSPLRILERLRNETDPGIQAALFLTLGTWEIDDLPTFVFEESVAMAQEHFRENPHAGVHSAAEWLLRKRGHEQWIDEANSELAELEYSFERQWHVCPITQMTLITVPYKDYFIQVSATEVTYQQFTSILDDDVNRKRTGDRLPMNRLPWFRALEFCRELTRRYGYKESDQCYPELSLEDPEQYPFDNYLQRAGFRLPNRWEADKSFIGDSLQRFHFGHDENLLPVYDNTLDPFGEVEECGLRKPSPTGFFNLMGNAAEWCNLTPNLKDLTRRPTYGAEVSADLSKVLRLRRRGYYPAETKFDSVGFRVVRRVWPDGQLQPPVDESAASSASDSEDDK